MFLLPLPLLFAGLGATCRGSAAEMLGELGGFAGLMLAAWLLNEGLRAEEAYAARAVARPPAIPRKLFAAVLTGASVALAGLLSLGQGAAGRARLRRGGRRGACCVAFGLDPMRKKGLAGRRRVRHRARRPRHRPGRGAGAPDHRRREAHRRPPARGAGRAALRPGARGLPRRRAGPARPRPGADLPQRLPARPARRDGQVRRDLERAAATPRRARPTRTCSATSRRASRRTARSSCWTTGATSTSRSRCCASG